jgi:hypothetical protein
MHPKNRMERGIALKAIANKAKELQEKGVSGLAVDNFVIGAREKLAEERPDVENFQKAAIASSRWAKQNA